MNEEDVWAEFEELTRPLIKWLNEKRHPHTEIVIYPDGAKLTESVIGYQTNDYIPD